MSEAEQVRLEKGRDGPADTLFETMAGFTFPFIMNYGFATCSGIYLMTIVEERERKTRTILTLSGVGSFVYYLALFLADLLLFIPPMTLFILFIVIFDIKVYAGNLDKFVPLAMGFGPALVAMTYFFSQAFKSNNAAVRLIVPFYIIVGTFLPLALIVVMNRFIEDLGWFYGVQSTLYFLDPFYTFFAANYSMIRKSLPPKYEYAKLLPGVLMDPQSAVASHIFQTLLYVGLSILVDYCRTNRFRSKDKREPKFEQPRLPVENDVI